MKESVMLKRLERALTLTAYASLVADIAISAVTVISLRVGQQYTIGAIFVLNYILTCIVVVALLVMAALAVVKHRKRLSWILRFFSFDD